MKRQRRVLQILSVVAVAKTILWRKNSAVHLQAKEMGREKMRSMGRGAGLWVGLMKVCHGQALVRGEFSKADIKPAESAA
jgi:hypothetical protein